MTAPPMRPTDKWSAPAARDYRSRAPKPRPRSHPWRSATDFDDLAPSRRFACSFGEDLCADQALRQQDGGRRAGVVSLPRRGLDDLAHLFGVRGPQHLDAA